MSVTRVLPNKHKTLNTNKRKGKKTDAGIKILLYFSNKNSNTMNL